MLQGYPGKATSINHNPNGVVSLSVNSKTVTTPLGLPPFSNSVPRVAVKHGNPGLCSVTALRYRRWANLYHDVRMCIIS